MDIKLNNSTGELNIKNGDIEFFKSNERYFEIIQQIVLMLHIREGELEYDIEYGLNFDKIFGTHGNVDEVLEHIRDKIYNNFKDYLSKCYILDYKFENRKLNINILIMFLESDIQVIVEGVGIGWQE